MDRHDTIKVLVGMSGGVDSSVAAYLLQEQGYQVIGATMQAWNGETQPESKTGHGCFRAGDTRYIEDSQRVAAILGIPLYVIDMQAEYQTKVLDYFRAEHLSGRTPNPCLRCNRWIKFDKLLAKINDSGISFDCFATGHYARIDYDESNQRYLLKKASDLNKDQSYFLSSLSQEQLAHSIFPLGDYTKTDVRQIARNNGLGVAGKAESQDFTVDGYHWLMDTVPTGSILNNKGEIIGEHRGIPFYTIGQRKGLGIASQEPLYVTAIDPDRDTITVGVRDELYQDSLIATGMNWIAIVKLEEPARFQAKIRSSQKETPVTVMPIDDDSIHVSFNEPQLAITPGQTIAFYQDDVVIGSGTIERSGMR